MSVRDPWRRSVASRNSRREVEASQEEAARGRAPAHFVNLPIKLTFALSVVLNSLRRPVSRLVSSMF